ncbi:12737_t:CDS:2, partial [Gigaspora rosea]
MSTNSTPKNVSCLKNLALNILKNSSQEVITKSVEVLELDPCSNCHEDYIKDLPQCSKCAIEIESIDLQPTNLKKLIDELTTEYLDSVENIIIMQSSTVPAGKSDSELVDFFSSYCQIVKAEEDSKKTSQDVIRAYYNFGQDLKK